MRTAIRTLGMTLVELLVACVAMLVLGSALLTLVATTYSASTNVTAAVQSFAGVRQAVDLVADHIRNAQSNGTQVLTAASPTGITYCTAGGGTVRYWFDSATSTLKRSDSAATTVAVSGIQSMTLTYYKDISASYTSTTSGPNNWPTTVDPNNPTAAELPNVGAVDIVLSITVNGYPRRIDTLVRLRNSPPGLPKI